MAQSKKKKQNKINVRPLLSLLIGLGFLSIILLVTMLSAPKKPVYTGDSAAVSAQGTAAEVESADSNVKSVLAVVKAIDPDNRMIRLYDVDSKELLTLSYSGGTNVTDKYGQVISMNQIETGSMVDAAYREDKGKLTDMNISTKAWEYVGVSNLGIDKEANVMKIADRKYRYNNDIQILDGDEFIPVADLAEQDELTVRGYEETIWSITVTRGHGTVILQDCEEFIGDNITIGYESMQQIAEDMEITVREGNFNLTVENGNYSATKNITVVRNQITNVSLSDLGPDVEAMGQIIFEITPFGADLFIDGSLSPYADPVELKYGEHSVKVSLGGYTSYEGTLTVDSPGKTVSIDLPESSSEDSASVTESDTQTDTGTSETSGGVTADIEQDPADYSDIDPDDIDSEHKIYVQEPVGASVYVDGSYMCVAPGNFKKIIGTHVITFIKEGYVTKSYTIEVSDDNLDTYFTFPNLAAE